MPKTSLGGTLVSRPSSGHRIAIVTHSGAYIWYRIHCSCGFDAPQEHYSCNLARDAQAIANQHLTDVTYDELRDALFGTAPQQDNGA